MNKNIVLIEPDYKNKYPPLGLMKISAYHKERGDVVVFYKGCSSELKNQIWERIYISTLFTFRWNKTIKTIRYYLNSVKNPSDIIIGGVMASIMKDEILKEFNGYDITIVKGLLNEKGKIGYEDDNIIDTLIPDYDIIEPIKNNYLKYVYPTKDSYIGYATRGCIRQCDFCAVPIIEPEFYNGHSIKKQVEAIKNNFGEKRNLLLLDNNILASNNFFNIIDEIKESGFEKNAHFSYYKKERKITVKRYVDFNQGVDARLLNKENMKKISEIAIRPLRIAFDDIRLKNTYIEKVRLAAEYGISLLSNYILFNYIDTPEEFYERLKINIELNEEFKRKGYMTKIWSFPMKYSPIFGEFNKNRKFIGNNWNKKYLRGIQCILLATHGVVGPRRKFFEKSFGKNINEFIKIITLPEDYIIYRKSHEMNEDIKKFYEMKKSLNEKQKEFFMNIVLSDNFKNLKDKTNEKILLELLELYNFRKKNK